MRPFSASAPTRRALLAKHGIITEPVLALVVSGLAAAVLGFATSFLVLRGSDLTRLMVTLGVALMLREIANQIPMAHRRRRRPAGRRSSGRMLGLFAVRYLRPRRLRLLPAPSCSFCSCWRAASSIRRSACRCGRCKGNPLRASAIGIPVNGRLVAIYTVAAGYAGVAGALLAQTTSFASLDVFSFERSADLLLVLIIGGTGYLYGGLIGAVIFKLMQDWLANLTPQYWQFWIGLVLVIIVLVGRDRIGQLDGAGAQRSPVGPSLRDARAWRASARCAAGEGR